MKLQSKIMQNTLKETKKVSLLFIFSLLLYFLIVVIINQGSKLNFLSIFGVVNKNHYSILLLIFNITYIVFITYKYLTYELNDIYKELFIREEPLKWLLTKLCVLLLFILTFKIVQYLFFGILYFLISKVVFIDISFLIVNISMFITITLITYNWVTNQNGITFILHLIGIFLLYKYQYIPLMLEVIILIFNLFAFNFKKILK